MMTRIFIVKWERKEQKERKLKKVLKGEGTNIYAG